MYDEALRLKRINEKARNIRVADKCLVEAYGLLVKANDLLFDAGWASTDTSAAAHKLFTVDSINEAIASTRHARHLIAKGS